MKRLAELRLSASLLQNVMEGETVTFPVTRVDLPGTSVLIEARSSPWHLSMGNEGADILALSESGELSIERIFRWRNETFVLDRLVVVGEGVGVRVYPSGTDLKEEDSRLVLGISEDTVSQIRRMRWMLVGTSRTGSHLATALLRLRPVKLVLVDPDVWEVHHRDGAIIPLSERFLGRFKAVSLGEMLEAWKEEEGMDTVLNVIPRSVFELPFEIFAGVDVLISAVDNVAARLYLDAVAESFRLLWVDVGVEAGEEGVGGEVRVFWPESPRYREEIPLAPWHWMEVAEGKIPKGDVRGVHPGGMYVTAGLGELALVSAIRGELEGGRIRWQWENMRMEWKAWSGGSGRWLDLLGRGSDGMREFQGWVRRHFG